MPAETAPTGLVDTIVETVKTGATFISTEWVWINHGMPFREVMDINHLYYRVCSPCDYFANDACLICRCRLVPNERSALNKLSMATTNCPLPEPRWISAITPPDDLAPEIAETALRNAKVNFVEVTETEQPSGDQPLMTVSDIKKSGRLRSLLTHLPGPRRASMSRGNENDPARRSNLAAETAPFAGPDPRHDPGVGRT